RSGCAFGHSSRRLVGAGGCSPRRAGRALPELDRAPRHRAVHPEPADREPDRALGRRTGREWLGLLGGDARHIAFATESARATYYHSPRSIARFDMQMSLKHSFQLAADDGELTCPRGCCSVDGPIQRPNISTDHSVDLRTALG